MGVIDDMFTDAKGDLAKDRASRQNHEDELKARQLDPRLKGMDFLKPSETGKTGMTLDEMSSLLPHSGRNDPWGNYLNTMEYLTQPRHDMGSDARRAAGGMPVEHGGGLDPVQMQQPGAGSSLMALLFGGGR